MPGSTAGKKRAGAIWRPRESGLREPANHLARVHPHRRGHQNNYLSNGRNDYNSYNGIIKIDHTFNEKHSISARYFGGTGTQTADVGSHIRDFFQVAPSHMHNVSVVENAVLTPSLVNQVTLGVNYFLQTFNDANTSFNPLALGLNTGVTDPTLIGSPKITISGFDYVGATQPLGRIDTTGHITDNLTWSHGRHQLKVGGEYRRARLDVFYQINKRGSFVFDGTRGPWSADASAQRKSPVGGGLPRRIPEQFQRRGHRAGRPAARLLPELLRLVGARYRPRHAEVEPQLRCALHLSRRPARCQEQRHRLRSQPPGSSDRATAPIRCTRKTGTISRPASASPTRPRATARP